MTAVNKVSIVFKKITKVTIAFVMFMSLCLFLFSVWIYVAPRPFPMVASYISQKVTELLPSDIEFKMSQVLLGFDDHYRLSLELKDLIFYNPRAEFDLSTINIFIDPIALWPQSNRNWLNLEIKSPIINFKKTEKGEEKSPEPFFARVNKYLIENKHKLLGLSIWLSDTELSFELEEGIPVKIKVNQLNFKPMISNESLIFNINGDFTIGGSNNMVSAILDTSSNNNLIIKGLVNNISHLTLNAFGLNIPELQSSSLEGDLSFTATLSNLLNINTVDFKLSNFTGIIKQNDFFPKDIKLKELLFTGKCGENCKTIMVDKVSLQDESINFEGNFAVDFTGPPTLLGEFKLKDLKVNEVQNYWPLPAFSRTRTWIFEHISEGNIKQGIASISLDLEKLVKHKNLDGSKIDITFYLEDTKVSYADKVSVLYDVDAIVQINADEVTFSIPQARILSSKITDVSGVILGLSTPESKVDVKATLKGPIGDLLEIGFAHTDHKNEQYLNLTGDTVSEINVSIPLDDRDIDLNIITLGVKSEIKNFKAPKILRDYDITDGTLTAEYINKEQAALINGNIKLNNLDLKIKAHQSFRDMSREIKAILTLNWDELKKFNIQKPEFADGKFESVFKLVEKGNKFKSTVYIDFKNTQFKPSFLPISKKAGEDGSLLFTINELDNDHAQKVVLDEYVLTLQDLKSTGKITLNQSLSAVESIVSNSTNFGKADFSFSYNALPSMKKIDIIGRSFDLSRFDFLSSASKESKKSDNNKSLLNVSMNVEDLYYKGDKPFKNNMIILECDGESCKHLSFKSTLKERDDFNAELKLPDIKVDTKHAAELFTFLGFKDEIEGGIFELNSLKGDDGWKGKLKIYDFKTKNIPVLATILSIASITLTNFESLSNMITGEGIKFKNLDCSYTYKDGILKIDNCICSGNSMSLSFTGNINFISREISIDGLLVPQNIVNSILRNTPVLNWFFGSEKEDGAIGINFKIYGLTDNVKVSSNPLSILAIGNLKKIFSDNN